MYIVVSVFIFFLKFTTTPPVLHMYQQTLVYQPNVSECVHISFLYQNIYIRYIKDHHINIYINKFHSLRMIQRDVLSRLVKQIV